MQVHIGPTPVDARFEVETDDGRQTVLVRSRGGRPPRNAEYAEGLEILLSRLGRLGAILEDAVVDSADTRRSGLTAEERRLDLGQGRNYPLGLSTLDDMRGLRLALGRSQASIGRGGSGTGGNPTKQIRLYVSLPALLGDDELARALAYGSRLLVVALPRSARRNLEWGLENGIWGFPVPRFEETERQRVTDYKTLRRGDTVLLLSGYTGGGPRAPLEQWRGATRSSANEFSDCYLCTVNQPYYLDATPFWPDELQARETRYPHRIGIDPVAIGAVSLWPGVDLSADVLEAARRSHIQNAQGFVADATGSPRLELSPTAPTPQSADEADTIIGPIGQGRAVDPIRRKRVEDRAVAIATAHYEHDGWTVTNVSRHNDETYGTPYDLRCKKKGAIRHVEVKGTTGSGETVRVSANERAHASADHADAESYLFVVEQIGLKTVKGDVRAVGGNVRYHGRFLAESRRFIATQYRYTVPAISSDGLDVASQFAEDSQA